MPASPLRACLPTTCLPAHYVPACPLRACQPTTCLPAHYVPACPLRACLPNHLQSFEVKGSGSPHSALLATLGLAAAVCAFSKGDAAQLRHVLATTTDIVAGWRSHTQQEAAHLESHQRAAGFGTDVTAAEVEQLAVLLLQCAASSLRDLSRQVHPPRHQEASIYCQAAVAASRRLLALCPSLAACQRFCLGGLLLDSPAEAVAAFRAAMQAAGPTNGGLALLPCGSHQRRS